MSNEYIKVGATFTVTLDIRNPATQVAAIDLTNYSGHRVYYRRPDGKTGYLSVDSFTATTLVATVDTTLNPLTVSGGDPKWRSGYSGNWRFYPYVPGAGSVTFRGKDDIVVVHPSWAVPAE